MYLTDDPIQKLEDDELGRTTFVEELAQSLLAREITESLVVSLDGPWGSGKSSVLNLLHTKIKGISLSNTEILRFDPWYFNSTERLLQSFLDEIYRVVEKRIAKDETKKKIEINIAKYKKILTSVQFAPKVSFMGAELSLGNLDLNLGNPDNIRNEIKDLIAQANIHVIILIDNLDRLDITELLLIFKLVRLCSDFPGYTFVMALDKQQILRLLEKSDLSFEFIDKIIQVDIKLPAIERYRIDNFLIKGLKYIGYIKKISFDDFFWTRFSQIYQSAISNHLITTLRDAKRLLNIADFSLPVVKGEVDYADFLILQFLRVFFPEVYEILPQFKSELTKFEIGGNDYQWMKKGKIAVFKELNEKIQTAYANNSKTVNDLMGFLFPKYGGYLQFPDNPPVHTYTNEYEKHQLIASRTHFDRYFIMKVAGDDIPTSAILNFIERLNAQGDNLNIQNQFLSIYQESNNVILAMKKLDLYIENINENAKLSLIRFLEKSSIAYKDERNDYRESETSSATKLAIDCILSLENNRQTELIREVILSSTSLLFSTLIAEDIVFGRWQTFSNETRTIILETIRIRIHKDLVDEKVDIFEAYPNSFSRILGAWKNKDFIDEEPLANQYTKELLEKKPEYAIKILSTFIMVVAGTGEPSDFRFGDFSARYDPKEFKGYINKVDLASIPLSNYESFAVKEFIRLYP